MKYYIVWFTRGITYKCIAKDTIDLLEKVKKEVAAQNKGEAKSDRIHYKRYWEVNEEEYKNSGTAYILT